MTNNKKYCSQSVLLYSVLCKVYVYVTFVLGTTFFECQLQNCDFELKFLVLTVFDNTDKLKKS